MMNCKHPHILNIRRRVKAADDYRKGSALVVVLGLMAIMLIAAVAFSVSMRIERQGAANFRSAVQARHMLWAALGYAIDDINVGMSVTNNLHVYPTDPDGVFASAGEGWFTNEETRAKILTPVSLDFIPDNLTNAAMSTPVYWRTVKDSGGTIIGRYSYMAIDCSGLIDANFAGTNVNARSRGLSPQEIVLESLPDVTDAQVLIDKRNARYYDTLSELVKLGDGIFLDKPVENLFPFSLALAGEFINDDNDAEAQVWIGGDDRAESIDNLTTNRDAIIEAFNESGCEDPGLVYSNLVDYVDEDCVPLSLADGHIDLSPMLNEAALYYYLDFEADESYRLHFDVGYLDLECMYPFKVVTGNEYELKYDLTFTEGSDNTHSVLVPSDINGTEEFNADAEYISKSVWDASKSGSLGTNEALVHFTGELKVTIEQKSDGVVVDQVPFPSTDAGLKFEVKESISAGDKLHLTNWVECLDPRFNGESQGVLYWWSDKMVKSAFGNDKKATIGDINNTTKEFFAAPGNFEATSDPDKDTGLHIANTNLLSVGELGNICAGGVAAKERWKTVRLYHHSGSAADDYHKVLDRFTVKKAGVYRGLVNINSLNPDVLASVFYDAPEDEITGAGKLNDSTKALDLAEEIINKGPYRNLSGLGEVDWQTHVSGSSEFEKEGLLRNTVGMLTTRQNIFTLILAADSYSEPVGGLRAGHYGSVRARSRAIAVVWRDPFPDENGIHRLFLRYFDILRD